MHLRNRVLTLALVICTISSNLSDNGVSVSLAAPAPPTPEVIAEQVNAMPLAFTKNGGQWDERVLFRTSSGEAIIWFCKDGIYYEFIHRVPTAGRSKGGPVNMLEVSAPLPQGPAVDSIEVVVVKAAFVDASPSLEVLGDGLMEHHCNYFLGSDPSRWHTDIPNYAGVIYKDVFPGVDARFEGEGGQLRAHYLARSDSDLSKVQFSYSGNAPVTLSDQGKLVIDAPWGVLMQIAPKPLLDGSVTDMSEADGARQRTRAGSTTLLLEYSTFLGGSGSTESGKSIAVDVNGSAYITGFTGSSDFPTQGAFDGGHNGNWDVFVTKLSPTGTSLIYSTFLGGGHGDLGWGIALDADGSAIITGETWSDNYPLSNAFDASFNTGGGGVGAFDAFVTKLAPAGNALVYSTFLGGNSGDVGRSIAVDESGSAYVIGYTSSSTFPTQNAYDDSYGGGESYGDAFVTKLSPAGNTLVYSSYLGGSDNDLALCVALDVSGSAYVAGSTASTDYPVENPYDGGIAGVDAFVTILSPAGDMLEYSTFLGGTGGEGAYGIAVDDSGRAYVTGGTSSNDYPTINVYDGSANGGNDAFVTKISASGEALVYSTYLGGSDYDWGWGIAIDATGKAVIVGETFSPDLPLQIPLDDTYGGSGLNDAFVAELSGPGTTLVYSSYIGGSGAEWGYGIAVDAFGNTYVTGETHSSEFQVVSPYDATYNGNGDAFVCKLLSPPNQHPVASCGGVIRSADTQCQAVVLPAEIDNGSFDPEEGTSIALRLEPSGPFEIGTTPVQLIVTDSVGAEDTCDATVTVLDSTPPVLICPSDIVKNSDLGECGAVVTIVPIVTDNCSTVSLSAIPASGSFFPLGPSTVTLIASDSSGNADTCVFSVTVNDTETPSANCPNDTVVISPRASGGATVAFVGTATDNCPGVSVVLSPASGSFFSFGTTSVQSIAIDQAGNSDTCAFSVTVDTLCACPCHADPLCDGVTDIVDVVAVVNVAFRGGVTIFDTDCTWQRTDVNCSYATDVIDVVRVVNVAFRGTNPLTEFCNPCP